jgi:hypothetical protein
MTPDQFRAALANLQLSQAGFARIAMVDARTVRRWCDGTRAVPGPVVALLGMMDKQRLAPHPQGTLRVGYNQASITVIQAPKVLIAAGGGGGGGSHPEPLGGGGMPIVRRWPDDKTRDVIDPGALDSRD